VLAPKDFNPVAMTLYPLAYIGRARAGMRTGDVEESRKAYEALLVLWKDADSDIPILRAAKREYRQLGIPRAGHDESSRERRGATARAAQPRYSKRQ
jgi:hypothetical protein